MKTGRRLQFTLRGLFLPTTALAGVLSLGRVLVLTNSLAFVLAFVYTVGPLAVFDLTASQGLKRRLAATGLSMLLLMSVVYWVIVIAVFSLLRALTDGKPREKSVGYASA